MTWSVRYEEPTTEDDKAYGTWETEREARNGFAYALRAFPVGTVVYLIDPRGREALAKRARGTYIPTRFDGDPDAAYMAPELRTAGLAGPDTRAIYPTVPDPGVPVAKTTDYGQARSCMRTDPKTGASEPIPDCMPTKFHPGIDLNPSKEWWQTHKTAAGFPVFAPFNGWILYSGPVPNSKDDDISRWLAGYGPGVVLLAHDDHDDAKLYDPGENLPWPRVTSWRYSLLAHVKPLFDIALDPDVRKLQLARGGRGKVDESKWIPGVLTNAGATSRISDLMTYEPDERRQAILQGGRYVSKGTLLGEMTARERHTHWEVRTTPFASPGPLEGPFGTPGPTQGTATAIEIAQQTRVNPHAWIARYVDVAASPPQQQAPAPIKSEDGDDWGWLILAGLGLYVVSEER